MGSIIFFTVEGLAGFKKGWADTTNEYSFYLKMADYCSENVEKLVDATVCFINLSG